MKQKAWSLLFITESPESRTLLGISSHSYRLDEYDAVFEKKNGIDVYMLK